MGGCMCPRREAATLPEWHWHCSLPVSGTGNNFKVENLKLLGTGSSGALDGLWHHHHHDHDDYDTESFPGGPGPAPGLQV